MFQHADFVTSVAFHPTEDRFFIRFASLRFIIAVFHVCDYRRSLHLLLCCILVLVMDYVGARGADQCFELHFFISGSFGNKLRIWNIPEHRVSSPMV